jgi:hypothetical protein
LKLTVDSLQSKAGREKVGPSEKWQQVDFNTEGTESIEEHGEENVRHRARAVGRWIEAVG